MEKRLIEDKIKEILIKMKMGDRITEEGVTMDGVDSIILLSVICLVEKEFGVEIPPQDIFCIRSMDDAVKIISDACDIKERQKDKSDCESNPSEENNIYDAN